MTWYIGALNDGKFIINRPPRPTLDDHWHDRPDGPTMALNAVALTDARAQAIVDAHNAELAAGQEALRACAEFVRRVEAGEIRSKRTYAQMKAIIAKAEGSTDR